MLGIETARTEQLVGPLGVRAARTPSPFFGASKESRYLQKLVDRGTLKQVAITSKLPEVYATVPRTVSPDLLKKLREGKLQTFTPTSGFGAPMKQLTISQVKREYGTFWDKYGVWVLVGTGAVAVAGGGYWYYRSRRRGRRR